MTITVAQLDTMLETEAAFKLATCCGSSKWVADMVRARPFHSREHILARAEEIADRMDGSDWLEAFSHHPKIGENNARARVSQVAATWSAGEQAGVSRVSGAVRDAMTVANIEYERKHGFIFIISASGRDADEIMSVLLSRLEHTTEEEMAIAALEQRKITRLRLEKLVT